MSPEARRKFAVLSPVLPPSPSGQAMMLGYLLSTFALDEYCLISTASYTPDTHTAAYFHLSSGQTRLSPLLRRLPGIDAEKNTPFRRAFRPLLRFYKRLRGDYRLADTDQLVDDLDQELRRILQQEGCSILVACTGMPQEMVAAQRACAATGVALVPYIFDYYGLSHTGKLGEYARQHEPEVLRAAAAIIVTNEAMAEEYRQLYGVACTIVRNPCRLPDLAQLDAAAPILAEDTFNIVYTGSIYAAHYDAFHNLIAAVERLGRPDVAIHAFTAKLPIILRIVGLKGDCFHLHGHIDHARVTALQRQADVLFLPLAFQSPIPETINTSSPGKVGEYLSVGRPILVHAPPESFLSWYFRTHECGLVVDKDDPAVLAEALARLLAEAGLRSGLGARALRQAAEFDLEAVAPRFKAVLDGIQTPSAATEE